MTPLVLSQLARVHQGIFFLRNSICISCAGLAAHRLTGPPGKTPAVPDGQSLLLLLCYSMRYLSDTGVCFFTLFSMLFMQKFPKLKLIWSSIILWISLFISCVNWGCGVSLFTVFSIFSVRLNHLPTPAITHPRSASFSLTPLRSHGVYGLFFFLHHN